MNVADLMTRLSVGEFSNLSMSGDGSGEIVANRQTAIITHANDALVRLYGRFILNEKNVLIRLVEGVTNYYLMKRFSESGHVTGSMDPIYIIDILEPFEEDVIKILEVRDGYGRLVTLNDTEDPHSMFTPQYNLLQIPRVPFGETLGVLYQARHRKLEPGVMEAQINVPEVLEKALLSYIAGEIYSHMNGPENSAKGREYMDKFDKICMEVIDRDLVNNTPSSTSEIFQIRGFV